MRAARYLLIPVIAVAATLAGCSVEPVSSGEYTRLDPPTSASTPTATTSSTPLQSRPPIDQLVDAGTVSAGAPASVSASGDSGVAVQRNGEFGVVASLDCSACTGTVTLTAEGRMSPYGTSQGPVVADFLVDVFQQSGLDNVVQVYATGPWTLTFTSWNELPLVTGPQSGTGPAVLYFGDDVSQLAVVYEPSGPDDSFSGRIFTESATPFLFGDSVAINETFPADLPGVIAVQTNGSWTLTPVP